jgi:hypothetical protein
MSGRYPYESNSESKLYTQPQLSQNILTQILELNGESLKSITFNGRNLENLCKQGAVDLKACPNILDEFFEIIKKSDKKVLLALDQVNSLYSFTSYCDKNSKPLASDKFQILKGLGELLTSESTNIQSVIAQDFTSYNSKFLMGTAEKSEIIASDKLQLPFKKYKTVSTAKSRLETNLDPNYQDYYKKDVKLSVYQIPLLDIVESESILNNMKASNLLYGFFKTKLDEITPEFVKEKWMLSQGYASSLIRSLGLY